MQCTSHQYCRYLHTDYFKYSPKTLKWDIIWSNNTKSPSKRVVSPLICLRCVLVDYPPPGLGARPRGHSRDDKIPPRLLLATLATRPPPLCPLSSPLSANGNCYSQSITINRGPQGLETRACNETNLWVVSQSQRRTQLGHCPGWKPFHITFIHFSHCYIMMLKRRPNGVSRHDVARTGEGPSGGFAEAGRFWWEWATELQV